MQSPRVVDTSEVTRETSMAGMARVAAERRTNSSVEVAANVMTWAFVVGEYPPQRGGVADYAFQVAEALCSQGDIVHVFAPQIEHGEKPGSAHVHRLKGSFGPGSLYKLIGELRRIPKPRRILVQYTAQTFGMRALNFPMVIALCTLRHSPLWVMFHEFAIRDSSKQSFARRLLALGTRWMAALLARFADRIFVSTPAWSGLVSSAAGRHDATWLPIPSNVPTTFSPESCSSVRSTFNIPSDAQVIGHFGTYRTPETRLLLQQIIPALLGADASRRFLLVGRNSPDFARTLLKLHPELAPQVLATGGLSSSVLGAYLGVCSVLMQPYPDGVTSRRGTLVAGLALGIPTITTSGALTEDFWASSEALLLSGEGDAQMMIDLAEAVLTKPSLSSRLSEKSVELYHSRFDLRHTITALRNQL